MAARSEIPALEVVELRRLPSGALDAVLAEETRTWREILSWDFSGSADLVRRFFDLQSLTGRAVVFGRRVIGYTYTVVDDDKGLLGDLYILREFVTPELEDLLLNATVESLYQTAGVRRIESQVILLTHPRPAPPARSSQLRLFERLFMVCDLTQPHHWPGGAAARQLEIEPWHERYQDDAAMLIAAAYDGHIDSQINDQYRSISGARRFLQNIVQYPGCGAFHPQASWLAWDRQTGRLNGLSLASLVSDEAGHITQLCVAPAKRSEGIGRESLTRSLRALQSAGCRQVSLTVTASNRGAISLYQSMGFTVRRRFAAMVWDQVRPARRFFS